MRRVDAKIVFGRTGALAGMYVRAVTVASSVLFLLGDDGDAVDEASEVAVAAVVVAFVDGWRMRM